VTTFNLTKEAVENYPAPILQSGYYRWETGDAARFTSPPLTGLIRGLAMNVTGAAVDIDPSKQNTFSWTATAADAVATGNFHLTTSGDVTIPIAPSGIINGHLISAADTLSITIIRETASGEQQATIALNVLAIDAAATPEQQGRLANIITAVRGTVGADSVTLPDSDVTLAIDIALRSLWDTGAYTDRWAFEIGAGQYLVDIIRADGAATRVRQVTSKRSPDDIPIHLKNAHIPLDRLIKTPDFTGDPAIWRYIDGIVYFWPPAQSAMIITVTYEYKPTLLGSEMTLRLPETWDDYLIAYASLKLLESGRAYAATTAAMASLRRDVHDLFNRHRCLRPPVLAVLSNVAP